jgi:hypothetical protein
MKHPEHTYGGFIFTFSKRGMTGAGLVDALPRYKGAKEASALPTDVARTLV